MIVGELEGSTSNTPSSPTHQPIVVPPSGKSGQASVVFSAGRPEKVEVKERVLMRISELRKSGGGLGAGPIMATDVPTRGRKAPRE